MTRRTKVRGKSARQASRAAAERRRRVRRLALVAVPVTLIVALAWIAMVRSQAPDPAGPAKSPAAVSQQGPAAVGAPFTDFTLTTADNEQLSAADLEGRPAILWFTTSTCVPCQVGARTFTSFADTLGDAAPRMVIVFVDPNEPGDALLEWRRKHAAPDWEVALDTDQLAQRAGVQVLDEKIFLDKDGIVRDIDRKPVDDAYLDTVRRLTAGP